MNKIQSVKYLRDLKEFLNSLTEDQLVQPIKIEFEESPFLYARKIVVTTKDFYVNMFDSEDFGTLEELQEIHKENFELTDYRIHESAGTIYLTD